jgi:hypothetical protein
VRRHTACRLPILVLAINFHGIKKSVSGKAADRHKVVAQALLVIRDWELQGPSMVQGAAGTLYFEPGGVVFCFIGSGPLIDCSIGFCLKPIIAFDVGHCFSVWTQND